MSGYGFDDPDGGYGEQPEWYRAARASVRAPGTALQWFGGISLALSLLTLVVLVVSPDSLFKPYYDLLVRMNKDQPAEQRQRLPRYEEFAKTQGLQQTIGGVIQLFASLLIFYGGSQMKEGRGYAFAIAGSILSMLPCNACCCVGFPLGAWALVALLGSDVRLAFARSRNVTRLE